MSNYADEQAFPCTGMWNPNIEEIIGGSHGLTKREFFAALAMQGMLASWPATSALMTREAPTAQTAIKFADELIKALEGAGDER